jgi:hypothetical protein
MGEVVEFAQPLSATPQEMTPEQRNAELVRVTADFCQGLMGLGFNSIGIVERLHDIVTGMIEVDLENGRSWLIDCLNHRHLLPNPKPA